MIDNAGNGGAGSSSTKKKKPSAIQSLAGAMANATMAPVKGTTSIARGAGRMVSGMNPYGATTKTPPPPRALPIYPIPRSTAPPMPRTDAGGRSGFGATKKPYTKYSV
jgi:hypothetical protein